MLVIFYQTVMNHWISKKQIRFVLISVDAEEWLQKSGNTPWLLEILEFWWIEKYNQVIVK